MLIKGKQVQLRAKKTSLLFFFPIFGILDVFLGWAFSGEYLNLIIYNFTCENFIKYRFFSKEIITEKIPAELEGIKSQKLYNNKLETQHTSRKQNQGAEKKEVLRSCGIHKQLV